MSSPPDNSNLAVFCDFENIALGVNEVGYAKFQIDKVLERLLVKGSIVVKKAYCDWSRYESFKRSMHEAAFELIDIPHVRQSGKNSADIRMVVDALDLCYTKAHVDTFVVVSGDSDFSPLVSKLRENNKVVIGVGVKHSTSDLLVANCDEFIFYDELVAKRKRPTKRTSSKSSSKKSAAAKSGKAEKEIEFVVETIESLIEEIGDRSSLWGSRVKQVIKRQRPGFNEQSAGFKSFNALLEEAQDRGLITLRADEKSGGYVIESVGD